MVYYSYVSYFLSEHYNFLTVLLTEHDNYLNYELKNLVWYMYFWMYVIAYLLLYLFFESLNSVCYNSVS